MANRTVNVNSIAPGTIIMIRGNVTFSRIASRIEGDELAKRIMEQQAKGWKPVDKPHTTLTIKNAMVLMQNPNAPTLAEKYATESLYISKQHPEYGYCYTGTNKSPNNLPDVGVREADGNTVTSVTPLQAELDNDLAVTLVLRVFKSKNAMNNGVSMDAVIVEEPIRYYSASTISKALESQGLTWNTPTHTAQAPNPNSVPNIGAPMAGQQPQAANQYAGAITPPPAQQVGAPTGDAYNAATAGGNMTGGPFTGGTGVAGAMNPPVGQQMAQPANQQAGQAGIAYNPANRWN